jgi:hypothetical protein
MRASRFFVPHFRRVREGDIHVKHAQRLAFRWRLA